MHPCRTTWEHFADMYVAVSCWSLTLKQFCPANKHCNVQFEHICTYIIHINGRLIIKKKRRLSYIFYFFILVKYKMVWHAVSQVQKHYHITSLHLECLSTIFQYFQCLSNNKLTEIRFVIRAPCGVSWLRQWQRRATDQEKTEETLQQRVLGSTMRKKVVSYNQT